MQPPIVVPLDTSVFSTNSLPLVRAIARLSGAAVHVVRLDPRGAVTEAGEQPTLHGSEVHLRRARATWESFLDHVGRYFVDDLGAGRLRAAMLEGRDVVEATASYASAQGAGLIVMTAHGLRSEHHGRGLVTAGRLAQASGLPVLAVHPDTDAPESARGGAVRRVMIVLSGSEADEEVVMATAALGGKSLHCTLLRVPETTGDADGPRGLMVPRDPCWGAHAPADLRAHAEVLRGRGHQVDARVVERDRVEEELSGMARPLRPDLIVVKAGEVTIESAPWVLFRAHRVPVLMVSSPTPDALPDEPRDGSALPLALPGGAGWARSDAHGSRVHGGGDAA